MEAMLDNYQEDNACICLPDYQGLFVSEGKIEMFQIVDRRGCYEDCVRRSPSLLSFHDPVVITRNVLIVFDFFLDVSDSVDHSGVIFATEIVPYSF